MLRYTVDKFILNIYIGTMHKIWAEKHTRTTVARTLASNVLVFRHFHHQPFDRYFIFILFFRSFALCKMQFPYFYK